MLFFFSFLKSLTNYDILNIRKAPTPKWMLPEGYLPLTERCPFRLQTGWAFYFSLFLLSRKVSNAITKLPKAISKPIILIHYLLYFANSFFRRSISASAFSFSLLMLSFSASAFSFSFLIFSFSTLSISISI